MVLNEFIQEDYGPVAIGVSISADAWHVRRRRQQQQQHLEEVFERASE